ncbi:MAG: hypothetical protein ACJ788_03205 [Ktedonobacteraceae bacterium]
MNEKYNITIIKTKDGFEAVVESPALRVVAATFEEAALEIERALVTWRLDQERKQQSIPA